MKNGIIDAFFSMLQNNPSVAAGTCTFAVAFALVAGNAFYAQSGSHPDPIWATRDNQTTQSISPSVRPVKVSKVEPKRIPTPLTGDDVRSSQSLTVRSPLVESIQRALVSSGDFSGAIDGLAGPVTRASIMDYQKRNGLPVTGEPTEQLLSIILNDTPKPVAASGNDDLKALIDHGPSTPSTEYDSNLVRKIQLGIVNAGIAKIEADGIYGSKTEAAISDFQRKNNLDVTGKPDIRVLEKLIRLGLV